PRVPASDRAWSRGARLTHSFGVAASAYFSALGSCAAGPLGPRSLLGGIPASRTLAPLFRSRPLRGPAARATLAARRDTRLADARSTFPLSAAARPGRSGHPRCSL